MAVLVTGEAGHGHGAEQAGSGQAHGGQYACAPAWTALTAAHAKIAGALAAELVRSCGLGINEFEILLQLDHGRSDAGLRQGDLLCAVRLSQPSLSRAVARLEHRGWLTRSGAVDDRRGILVTITDDGRAVLRRAAPVHARTIRELLLDRLAPAEQDLLARALSRITGS